MDAKSRSTLGALAVAAALATITASSALGDTIHDPPHPHTGANVVTWLAPTHVNGDAHDISVHQHQHRTNHDPRQGTMTFGGVEPYRTDDGSGNGNWVWVGQNLISDGGAGHGALPTEFAHGHQGDSPNGGNVQPAARYHVHTAVAGGDISAQEAADFNANALNRVFDAFNGIAAGQGWLDVGNASGLANWPTSDDDTQAGTGVPWHSAVNWVAVDGSQAHELHIVLGEAGVGAKAVVSTGGGHFAPGAGAMTMTIDDDVDAIGGWFWGVDANPLNNPTMHDAQTTILHEAGHVLGLSHFGTYDSAYIMAAQDALANPGRPDRSGTGGIQHSIDADSIHGVRDLYAIAAPEPTSLVLALLGGGSLFGIGLWKRRAVRDQR